MSLKTKKRTNSSRQDEIQLFTLFARVYHPCFFKIAMPTYLIEQPLPCIDNNWISVVSSRQSHASHRGIYHYHMGCIPRQPKYTVHWIQAERVSASESLSAGFTIYRGMLRQIISDICPFGYFLLVNFIPCLICQVDYQPCIYSGR